MNQETLEILCFHEIYASVVNGVGICVAQCMRETREDLQ